MSTPANDLNINQAGLVVFDGTATFLGRTLQAGTGISISNGSGIAGNPIISIVGGGAEVETLSDDVGTVIQPALGNIQLVGHVVEQGSTKFSTIVAGTNLANINPMSSARWIVDKLGFNGTHTTIATALTSATSGDTIFLLPGTYTENITLKAGVNISAFDCDSLTPNVTINGTCTMTATGTVSMSGIRLQTNSAALISITGTNQCIINLKSCYLNCSNATGISIANTTGSVNCYECQGDIGTTGIGLYSTTGPVAFYQCYFTNSGTSITASLINGAANPAVFINTTISSPVSTSTNSAFISAKNSVFSATNTTNVTLAGAGGSNFDSCIFASGTASAISIGTGTSAIVERCAIDSSNTNCITGAGSITYQGLTFPGTDSPTKKINVTTQINCGTLYGGVNQSPAAGFLGEQIRSYIPSGSAVSLSNNSPASIANISLTPGIWDVSGVFQFVSGATTIVTQVLIGISATNNTIAGNYGDDSLAWTPNSVGVTQFIPAWSIPALRVTLTTTTTYYIVAQGSFTTSTFSCYGRISATRVG